MATHSLIGVEEEGKVTYSEVHYNGQPENMLPVLTKKYYDNQSILELISKGRIFEIESTITKEEFESGAFRFKGQMPTLNEPSYFKDLLPFNYDEKDKSLNKKVVNLESFLNHLPNTDDYEAVYYYLFKDGIWNYSKYDENFKVA
jgi:hypothetical protein